MSRTTPSKPTAVDAVPDHDPIAPWCSDVLAVFGSALADVRFPELDLGVLEAAAELVRHAQLDVESKERALADARTRTHDAHATLAELCAKGLAYAKVFAEGRSDIATAVAGIRPPRPTPDLEAAPKKRGRPRKDSATVDLLPEDAAAAQ